MPVMTFEETAVLVVPINTARHKIYLQNTGEEIIYFTKFKNTAVPNIPSATNYDFILYPSVAKDASGKEKGITEIDIFSVAGIRAYCAKEASLAYFETVNVGGL